MKYTIVYESRVHDNDAKRLSGVWKNVIHKAIEKKLVYYPEHFGKPLRRSLKHFWSLRVGDYRVIFLIDGKTVRIVMIVHRSTVYQELHKLHLRN